MVRVLGAVLMLVTLTSTARGEEPRPSSSASAATAAGPPAASVDTAKTSCATEAPAADSAAEERAFSAELESYARRRVFTERLIAKREAEAFERAVLRQTRAANLKRELTAREAAIVEREFDEAVVLYLKKRELTLALSAAASRAKATPPEPATAPTTSPSP
jgi:hypothetical protein